MNALLCALPTNRSLYVSTSLHRIASIANSSFAVTPSLLKPLDVSLKPQIPKRLRLVSPSCSNPRTASGGSDFSKRGNVEASIVEENEQENQWKVEIRSPVVPPLISNWLSRFAFADRGFFLLALIACTTSAAFASLVIATVPTLFAMRRAAISLARLADTAREELPSTMAALRLSSMEISDLTLELSDLSKEVSEGIFKTTQAVQAAEAGIKQMGDVAHQKTVSMIQERANLPVISIKPVVSGAAKKTSRAVGNATRTIMGIFTREESSSVNFDDDYE